MSDFSIALTTATALYVLGMASGFYLAVVLASWDSPTEEVGGEWGSHLPEVENSNQ